MIIKKEKSGEYSRKDVLREMDLIRKEAIMEKNKLIISRDDDQLESTRKSSGKKIICSKCKGAYKSKYFSRHQNKCPARNMELSDKDDIPFPLNIRKERSSGDDGGDDDEWRAIYMQWIRMRYLR